MADLLYKKLLISLCALTLLCQSAYSFESSFPFPFEFGHSSDIYFRPKKNESQQIKEMQAAKDEIERRKISTDSSSILKYIKNNNAEVVELLLNAGMRPNESINANMPIYYAVKYKSNDVLKVLLKKGADPNGDLDSVLRNAIRMNNVEAANLLIQYGANINYYNGIFDETILCTTLKNGEYELAKALIEKGAQIDSKSYKIIKDKKLEKKLGIKIDK